MERFWVYLDNKVQGPVEIPALRKLTGFNLLTQVCPEGQEAWRMADDVIEIKAYFSAPPRGSSLLQDKLLPKCADRPAFPGKTPNGNAAGQHAPRRTGSWKHSKSFP